MTTVILVDWLVLEEDLGDDGTTRGSSTPTQADGEEEDHRSIYSQGSFVEEDDDRSVSSLARVGVQEFDRFKPQAVNLALGRYTRFHHRHVPPFAVLALEMVRALSLFVQDCAYLPSAESI
jgi:hypothetical protein